MHTSWFYAAFCPNSVEFWWRDSGVSSSPRGNGEASDVPIDLTAFFRAMVLATTIILAHQLHSNMQKGNNQDRLSLQPQSSRT